MMSAVAHGIFAAVVALGVVPIIRAPPGGAAEMVARAVHELIASALGAGGVFPPATSGGRPRPLLVITERALDAVAPLQHTATYQVLY